MGTRPAVPSPEDLLAHAGFIRAVGVPGEKHRLAAVAVLPGRRQTNANLEGMPPGTGEIEIVFDDDADASRLVPHPLGHYNRETEKLPAETDASSFKAGAGLAS